MVRCFLLFADERRRTDIDWSGVVQKSSKSRSGKDCGFDGSSERRGDGGEGPSLGLEDGVSEDGRSKRHLDVSPNPPEGREHGL